MTKKTGVKVMGLFDKLLKNMVKDVVNTQQEQQQYIGYAGTVWI